jgi:hypothetical protein
MLCTYNVTLRRVHANNFCCGKAMSITYSLCVFVAVVIQHAMRMGHFVMCPARLYSIIPNYLINDTILEKKVY